MPEKENFRKKTAIILISITSPMTILIIMNIVGIRISMLQNLGFTKESLSPWYIWVITLILSISYILYTFKMIPSIKNHQLEFSLFKMIGLFSISGAIVEEVFFRRWIMDLLYKFDFNNGVQILISGLLFGAGHLMWGFFNKKNKFSKGAFFSTTILGALLGCLYIISNRNIGPCIIAHSIINIVIEPWLILAAVSDNKNVSED